VLAPAHFGGLEGVVQALAAGHAARGHEVFAAPFLVDATREPPLLDALRRAGVGVHPIVFPPRSYRAQLAALRASCAELQPDVVHSHGYLADVLTALSVRRGSVPIATTVHGFTGGGVKNRLYEWLQVRSHRRFAAVIAVSRSVRTRLERAGVRGSRIHTIANAFHASAPALEAPEAREVLGAPRDLVSVGWIGRISREKGLDVLVQALPALADLPMRVTVVGDGEERVRVEALARTLGVAHRIVFRGVVRDAGRLLSGFDLLVLSSRTEGTPITLLEAMAARVPIVATAVGGVPDVVSPAEALLVPSEAVAALAGAIRAVVADPAAAAGRAERAHARLESAHALEPWLDAYEGVYRALPPSTSRTAR
jgi:glycosyltransferase involved in cell wall biosynthesis